MINPLVYLPADGDGDEVGHGLSNLRYARPMLPKAPYQVVLKLKRRVSINKGLLQNTVALFVYLHFLLPILAAVRMNRPIARVALGPNQQK